MASGTAPLICAMSHSFGSPAAAAKSPGLAPRPKRRTAISVCIINCNGTAPYALTAGITDRADGCAATGERVLECGQSFLQERAAHRKCTAKTTAIIAMITFNTTPTRVQYPGGTTEGSKSFATWRNWRADINATAAPKMSSRTPNASEKLR